MSTINTNESNTRDMVASSSNGLSALFTRPGVNLFGSPSSSIQLQRRDQSNAGNASRIAPGSLSFQQHWQKSFGRPSSYAWRQQLRPSRILPSGRNIVPELDEAAPAPFEQHPAIRLQDIPKLAPVVKNFERQWESFSNPLDMYPYLHSIHTCTTFKLPYPSVTNRGPEEITDTIMDYNLMATHECEEDAKDEETDDATIARLENASE